LIETVDQSEFRPLKFKKELVNSVALIFCAASIRESLELKSVDIVAIFLSFI